VRSYSIAAQWAQKIRGEMAFFGAKRDLWFFLSEFEPRTSRRPGSLHHM